MGVLERGRGLERLELGPRLRAIAGLVPDDCRVLADIGTDHGYIPAALLLEGRIARAIAADVGREPLEHARRTAARLGLAERLSFRLGDGLSVLEPGEADAAVIAGMGGDTIVNILDAAPWSREGLLLLLQPMSRAETLRMWLADSGFAVLAERLAEDKGTLYPILTVRGGPARPGIGDREADAWGGFLLDQDPLWGRYLEDRILRLRKAAGGLARARDPALAERRQTFLRIINALENRKGEWQRAQSARDRGDPV